MLIFFLRTEILLINIHKNPFNSLKSKKYHQFKIVHIYFFLSYSKNNNTGKTHAFQFLKHAFKNVFRKIDIGNGKLF